MLCRWSLYSGIKKPIWTLGNKLKTMALKCLTQGSRRYSTNRKHCCPHVYAMPKSVYQNQERLDRGQLVEITSQVWGLYHEFKQKLAKKENSVNSEVNKSHPLFDRSRRRAASFKKLTNRALSKEVQIWKQKLFSKSRVFSVNFLKNSTKRFFAQIKAHMKTEQMLRSVSRHKIEATLQMMGFVVNYRKRQKQLN